MRRSTLTEKPSRPAFLRSTFTTLLVSATVTLSGCWAAQNTAASAEYARQVTTANLRVSQMEALLADSKTRVEQLEEFVRLQGQNQATRLENLDEVNAEVVRLRGQIEVLQFDMTSLTEGLDAAGISQERRQLHDERRLRQVEEFLGVKAPPAPTDEEMGLVAVGDPDDPDAPDPDPSIDPVDVPDAPPTAKGKLEAAAAQMAAGRQAVARAILLKAASEHADDRAISEIRYRLAETYLNEKNYGKAALSFKAVIDDHPDSGWASWSMLRQGECFDGLGQTDNARLFFDGVIQRYPKSEAAKEAKKKLNR